MTTRSRKPRKPGSAAPSKVTKNIEKVREAEEEAEVTSMMAESAHIDRGTAEREAQKPPTFSSGDMGGDSAAKTASKQEADAREATMSRDDRDKAAAEAQAKVAELTISKEDVDEAEDLGISHGTDPLPSRVPPDPVQPRSDMTPEELKKAAKEDPKIFSSADMLGGVPDSDTAKKIHSGSKAHEGASDTDKKLRSMGLTGPGY